MCHPQVPPGGCPRLAEFPQQGPHSFPGSASHITLPFPVPPAGRGDRGGAGPTPPVTHTANHVSAGTLADTVLNCKIYPSAVPWIRGQGL